MIWISKIEDLEYYNHSEPVPCYCETLVDPADLVLQTTSLNAYKGTLTLSVKVYTTDGLTILEDATSYFSWYVFSANGATYANLKLNSFSPTMCSEACWILRVSLTSTALGGATAFDKYTERYCNVACCNTTKGIIFAQEGLRGTGSGNFVIDLPLPPLEDPTSSTASLNPEGPCGEPMLRLRADFPCVSANDGNIYGIPTQVIQGTASFPFTKSVNFIGRIVQRPREITVNISYNCKVQRTESFKPYLLESLSWALFPAWKMSEIEDMFTAPALYVYDYENPETQYRFAGGTPFKRLVDCWELYKLEVQLQSCVIRQTFECGNPCATGPDSLIFAVPLNYSDGAFYTENKLKIANNISELITWYGGQDGVQSVTDVSDSFPNAYSAFSVSSYGYIMTSFYYDAPIPRNRVFGSDSPSLPSPNCEAPLFGTITVSNAVCHVPEFGSPLVIDVPSVTIAVTDYGNWNVSEDLSHVVTSGEWGNLTIQTVNTVTVGTDSVGYIFGGEIIGKVAPGAIPASQQYFTHREIEAIPEGSSLAINPDGGIVWWGVTTSFSSVESRIELSNIIYKLTL